MTRAIQEIATALSICRFGIKGTNRYLVVLSDSVPAPGVFSHLVVDVVFRSVTAVHMDKMPSKATSL